MPGLFELSVELAKSTEQFAAVAFSVPSIEFRSVRQFLRRFYLWLRISKLFQLTKLTKLPKQ